MPRDVERAESQMTEQVVHAWVQARAGTRFTGPECSEACPCTIIRSGAGVTWIPASSKHCFVPRVTCATDGVLMVTVPSAERRSHFTLLFEGLAIAWLK